MALPFAMVWRATDEEARVARPMPEAETAEIYFGISCVQLSGTPPAGPKQNASPLR